jgi:hypothetical protein
MGSHLFTLSVLSDELTGVWLDGKEFRMIGFVRALESISDTLHDCAGQMRYMEGGQGGEAA